MDLIKNYVYQKYLITKNMNMEKKMKMIHLNIQQLQLMETFTMVISHFNKV